MHLLIAFFDFDKQHYFSPIRSRRWNVQGIRGEIQNDMVCYLNERNQPITERMYREDDGINNIDGWSHRYAPPPSCMEGALIARSI